MLDVEKNNMTEAMVDETSVDWRGRPSKTNKHGGMSAAIFVLGLSLSLSIFLCPV